jgi:hypothetical protein
VEYQGFRYTLDCAHIIGSTCVRTVRQSTVAPKYPPLHTSGFWCVVWELVYAKVSVCDISRFLDHTTRTHHTRPPIGVVFQRNPLISGNYSNT